jgi:histone deacetylase 1/2
MGNGQGVSISSLGQSHFTSPHNPAMHLHLKDLLHVPHISKNLLSVSKFAQDNNVIFEFHPYTCFVKSQDSKQVLLEGTVGSDGLYQFKPFKFLPPTGVSFNSNFTSNKAVKCNNTDLSFSKHGTCSNSLSAVQCNNASPFFAFSSSALCNSVVSARHSDNSFQLWHLRLGHAHLNAVKSVLSLCNVPFNNKSANFLCTHCCIGKSHRLHAPLSNTVYTKPFEVVHCDLWGPAPFVSYYGYSYYITFVDTYTKYTWIYFLKSKSDALKAFTNFLALVQNQFQASIKALQSDWGGEFRPFTSLLHELGIQHRLTCPHTSHQNGTVERKHRQIVEMGLTLLSHASLPLKFWDHSFTQAVYLINKLPSSAIPQFSSPHHALHKSQPDFSTLKTFGCLCFPHLRPYNRHKLQFRSSPCVYLGISPQHKGHKCLDGTGRIYISKDVIFHESKFPYMSLFPSSHTPQSSGPYPANIIFPSQSADNLFHSTSLPCSSQLPDTSTPMSPSSHGSHNNSTPLSPSPVDSSAPPIASAVPIPPDINSPAVSPDIHTPPPLVPAGTTTQHISHHNNHPMITIGKIGNLKPKVFLAELEPKTI